MRYILVAIIGCAIGVTLGYMIVNIVEQISSHTVQTKKEQPMRFSGTITEHDLDTQTLSIETLEERYESSTRKILFSYDSDTIWKTHIDIKESNTIIGEKIKKSYPHEAILGTTILVMVMPDDKNILHASQISLIK